MVSDMWYWSVNLLANGKLGGNAEKTVTYSEAEEIANHYRKYLKMPPERILIVEVPNVIKARY